MKKTMKNLLLRFYNIERGEYGEPFAMCSKGYEIWKQTWLERGLLVQEIGMTDWTCNNHKDHSKDKAKLTAKESQL